MFIEQINLQGFLSFIKEIVDFRKKHVVLVSGINGQGKSALLESIPFCFWGSGRGKTLSQYINDTCDTTRVEIVFLSSENVRYKKVRQFGEKGSINELYIDKVQKTLEDVQWKLISDDTKRKTDEFISSILGLDYDLFCNSVFFGQKEASSFISGEASDRKELLCSLLGIQVYEKAEEEAKSIVSEIDSKLQTKQFVLSDKKKIVDKKDEIKTSHVTTSKQIKVITANIEQLQENIESHRKKRENLKVQESNFNANKEKLVEINEQISKTNRSLDDLNMELVSSSSQLDSMLDEGIEKVEGLQEVIDKEAETLERKKKYETKLSNIQVEKAKIPSIKTKLDVQRNGKERVLQQQSELNTIIKALNTKNKKINDSGAICPVIEQPCDKLSENSKKKMVDEIEREIKKRNSELEKLQTELDRVKDNIVELNGQIDAIAKRVESESTVSSSLADINNEIKNIESAKEQLPKVKVQYRKAVDKLTLAKEKIETKIKETKIEKDELVEKKTKIQEKVTVNFSDEIGKVDRQIRACNDDIKELTEEKNGYIAQIGQLNSQIEQIEVAEQDVKTIQIDIDKLSQELRVHTELSIAFGKNGIQKDIISNNVPILEEKTNELLSMFCKNSKSLVKFDLDPVTASGKAKKRGGLDILIYENGKDPRPLNMYSGGETVRIVFAILLSLSYLLTKRAGKSSQTLIIDERVAALDSEGINQFVEIVKLISSQYKKILVVSHISELKVAFQNEMIVEKGIEGSKVTCNF